MSSQSIDQAIYLIAKELVGYTKERGGQLKPGGGLRLSIAYSLLKWVEEEYEIKGISDIVLNGLTLSHNEISVGETVAMKNIEKITIGLMQRYEVVNQAMRGVPFIPAPEISKSNSGLLKRIRDKIGV